MNFKLFFFFNDTATTEIYTLSLHDALPICYYKFGGKTNKLELVKEHNGKLIKCIASSEDRSDTIEDTYLVPADFVINVKAKKEEPQETVSADEHKNKQISIVTGIPMIEKPVEITALKFRCFDSNNSRLHYFIAPRYSFFCTNSYEYMNYNEYLYELLREQRYDRVVIVSNRSSNEGNNYPVLAFDCFTQQSFK